MLKYNEQRNMYADGDHYPPISRTLRYKKVTKPLLERKRRARINRCLDELKDLVGALEAEGENINKLEKADILELTVKYLKRISKLQDPVQEAHRFQAGFSQCASEACAFLLSLPGLNKAVGNRLIDHLRQCISKHRLPPASISTTQQPTKTPIQPIPLRVNASLNTHRFSPPISPLSLVNPTLKGQLQSPTMHRVSRISNPESNLSNDSSNPMWRPW